MREIVLAGFIFLFCIFNTSIAYSDINETHWGFSYINKLTKEGIIKGYSNGMFKPEDNTTRAEFITMLVKVVSPTIDEDIKNTHWADKYINQANKIGIIEKDDYVTFDKDKPITRYEIAKMMVKSFSGSKAAYLGEEELEVGFTDKEMKSKEVKNMVAILKSTGIIKGYPDNTVKLSSYATRADACAFMNNFIENKEKLENFSAEKPIKNYYGVSRFINYKDLPFSLEKWKDYEEESAPVTTTIQEISMFEFSKDYQGKYKDILAEFYNSNKLYFEYKRKLSDGKYVIAVEFLTQNNHPQYETMAGHNFLILNFPDEEDIKTIESFDTDEISYQREENPYIGVEILPNGCYKSTAFYVVNRLPKEKIKFNRSITTMYDNKNHSYINISSYHSLVVGDIIY
jgi:hypothetical protein